MAKSSEWVLFVECEREDGILQSTSFARGEGGVVAGFNAVYAYLSQGLIGSVRVADRLLFEVTTENRTNSKAVNMSIITPIGTSIIPTQISASLLNSETVDTINFEGFSSDVPEGN